QRPQQQQPHHLQQPQQPSQQPQHQQPQQYSVSTILNDL
ncbi:unnamed protein product, partial [Adineta steineri]